MGTGKIRYIPIVILFIFAFSNSWAQAEYVDYDHSVYGFLERMSTLQLIDNFNSLERPLTRKIIADYLRILEENKNLLSNVDRNILNDFLIEFEYDIFGTSSNSQDVFSSGQKYQILSNKESFLYSIRDSSNASIFINLLGNVNFLSSKNPLNNKYENAAYTKYGGIIRGTILNKFGFSIKTTNGIVSGSKAAAKNINEVNFSYKFNEDLSESNFVDNTEGYLTADFDFIKFKIGRDRKIIGFGPVNYILSDNNPLFDHISFNIDYKIFSFSFFHGKLLGRETSYEDSTQGVIRNISEKYFGYHRIGLNFSRDFSLGAGEMIVYSGRSIDLSYLNPFNFYKSAEHQNQDRDNSLLFFDIFNNSLKGLKLFGSLLIDDIDFGKLGTKWYRNQLLYNFTLYSANLYKYVPVDIYIQYLRIDPYVYTHRILNNNYTNMNYSLAAPLQPNSDVFTLKTNYNPYHRLIFSLEFSFTRHGANEYDNNGNLIRNVGGDILVGHRPEDNTEVTFLDGKREYYRSVSLFTNFEPYNNYFISNIIRIENASLYNRSIRNLFFSLGVNIKI